MHFLEAGSNNQRALLCPFERLRQVEHHEVFWRWRRLHWMSAAHSEFEMHCCAWLSHHCSVEAVVISEGPEDGKAEASAIHFDGAIEVGYRPSNAEMGDWHAHTLLKGPNVEVSGDLKRAKRALGRPLDRQVRRSRVQAQGGCVALHD